MAADNRIKNKAGVLKDKLNVQLFLEDLIQEPTPVLGSSQYSEVCAVLQQRGRFEANRTLIGHLLVGKWKEQIDQFVKILFKYQDQRPVARELDPALCDELARKEAEAASRRTANGSGTERTGRPAYLDCKNQVTLKQVDKIAEKLASREKYLRLTDELEIEPDDVELWINKDGINSEKLRAREILVELRRDGLAVGKLATALHNSGFRNVAEMAFMSTETTV